jgi:multidrug efflux pump subunit AcrA (membrane-fusion protein)
MNSRPAAVVLRGLLFLVLVATTAFAAAPLFTCGMHPQILKPEPGNCPICGMKLTPVRATAGAAAASATGIQLDGATIQRMNLKTDVVSRGPVQQEIRTVGTVAFDEAGQRDITLKYEGWLERVFVETTWSVVKAGDPLFEIYSPDLYNAQLNYLVALRSEGESGGPLTRAALSRLQLFGLAPDFLTALARRGEAARTYVYRAPTDGTVVEKMAVAGQMMKPGERLYRLANLSHVWVLAQIFERDLGAVRVGQVVKVRTTYGPARELAGEMALILPRIEEQTRSATARIVLPNPDGALRPGMFVEVRFTASIAESAVLVPEMAVLRSGEKDTVFLARDGGTFEAREVKLGARNADGRYQVLSGLKEGERVVTSGQFMLDSESQLREAIQKLTTGPAPAAAVTAAPPPRLPAGAAAPLRTLALAVADAAPALAADDVATYKEQLPALRAALAALAAQDAAGPWTKLAANLAAPADLTIARGGFEPFSTAVTDAARAEGVVRAENLSAFECPMAPVLGKGRWLQRDAALRNPFFGSRMLKCGTKLD